MNRIRELRKERKLTLDELADLVGVTHSSIARYEHDESKMRADVGQKLADFFDVSLDYILGKTNEKQKNMDVDVAFYEQFNKLSDDKKNFVLKVIKSLDDENN